MYKKIGGLDKGQPQNWATRTERYVLYSRTPQTACYKNLLSMMNPLSNAVAQNELPLAKVGGVTEGMVELWQV